MESLNTTTVNTSYNTANAPVNNGSSGYQINLPTSSVTLPKPLSYEFRVAEFVNEKDEVQKVGLQVKVWEHDSYGMSMLKKDWADVPRVKLPFVG